MGGGCENWLFSLKFFDLLDLTMDFINDTWLHFLKEKWSHENTCELLVFKFYQEENNCYGCFLLYILEP